MVCFCNCIVLVCFSHMELVRQTLRNWKMLDSSQLNLWPLHPRKAYWQLKEFQKPRLTKLWWVATFVLCTVVLMLIVTSCQMSMYSIQKLYKYFTLVAHWTLIDTDSCIGQLLIVLNGTILCCRCCGNSVIFTVSQCLFYVEKAEQICAVWENKLSPTLYYNVCSKMMVFPRDDFCPTLRVVVCIFSSNRVEVSLNLFTSMLDRFPALW